ncbi:N-glycosylase/DNA lyase [Candidatus Bathyarchaeota archaeon]|nr:N-glycosylase/DNA lyase [Candidatus Bathyarchaeota archaeon]
MLNSAEKLLEKIEILKNSGIKKVIETRIKQFEEMRNKPSSELFKELAYCILCANFNAERSMSIQKAIGNGFICWSEKRLAQELKALGHRFPNTRAKYIVEARKHVDSLESKISSFNNKQELRDWLIGAIKGLGMKESSHFLRNIGFSDFAILDFHIINVLVKYGLIDKPSTLTKKKYLEIETFLRYIADKANLNLAELDLYLWFMETGKILK